MSHHHHHSHEDHLSEHISRAFRIGIALNLLFVCVEAVAGIWLGSLALLSDAGHNLSDVAGLLLASFAFRLSQAAPSAHYTYGYKKSTILVSLLNAVILLVAVGVIIVESIRKLQNPEPVNGDAIAWVAAVGIVINAFTAYLFFKDRRHDLNIKGAYLHMAADTLVSVGVLFSGVLIRVTGFSVIDPIIGLIIAIVIMVSTWSLLHDSLRLSLDGVPLGIDVQEITDVIKKQIGVLGIHDVHIWAISTTQNAFTAHIVIADLDKQSSIKEAIKCVLHEKNITHATLEFELKDESCQGICPCE